MPYVTVLLALYAWAAAALGFIVVTVLLLLVLFRTVEPQGWCASILGAVVRPALPISCFTAGSGRSLPARATCMDRLAPWIF